MTALDGVNFVVKKSNHLIFTIMKKLVAFAILISSTIMMCSAQNISKNCYRGYADVGYTFGIGDYNFGRVEVNTSHGYQINPYLFVGAGVGLHFMQSYKTSNTDIALDVRDSKVDIPVFANIRCNFLKKKVSPFIDLKAGTFVSNGDGLYINASAGCRIATNEKQAVNISLGYTREKLEFQTFDEFVGYYNLDYTRRATTYNTEGISLKVGYEF